MPKLKMMDGMEMSLDESRAQQVKEQLLKGAKFIHVMGALLNASSISGVYPDKAIRREMAAGRLHDGTMVVRKYGRWVDAENEDANLSPSYYPEIGRDDILSDEEWTREVSPLETTSARRERYDQLIAEKATALSAPSVHDRRTA